jgi:hypothetical protein
MHERESKSKRTFFDFSSLLLSLKIYVLTSLFLLWWSLFKSVPFFPIYLNMWQHGECRNHTRRIIRLKIRIITISVTIIVVVTGLMTSKKLTWGFRNVEALDCGDDVFGRGIGSNIWVCQLEIVVVEIVAVVMIWSGAVVVVEYGAVVVVEYGAVVVVEYGAVVVVEYGAVVVVEYGAVAVVEYGAVAVGAVVTWWDYTTVPAFLRIGLWHSCILTFFRQPSNFTPKSI